MVDKIGDCLKKGVPFIFILTNLFQCYLSVSVWCVCICVLFIYTTSISIICVSQEEPCLIASNQQIHDFYKWIIFGKKRHCGNYIFDISELFIQGRKDSYCEHITDSVNIYLYGCVILLPSECVVCLCVCDTKSEYQTSVNVTLCCIKHTPQGPSGTKVQGSTCVDP